MMKWTTVSIAVLALASVSCTSTKSEKPAPAKTPAVTPAAAPAKAPAAAPVVAPAPAKAPAAASVVATPAAATDFTRVRGVIADVKADTKTVTLTSSGRDGSSVTFVITDDTVLLPKGTTLQDMKAGVNLRVDYTESSGKKTAVKIRIDG